MSSEAVKVTASKQYVWCCLWWCCWSKSFWSAYTCNFICCPVHIEIFIFHPYCFRGQKTTLPIVVWFGTSREKAWEDLWWFFQPAASFIWGGIVIRVKGIKGFVAYTNRTYKSNSFFSWPYRSCCFHKINNKVLF